MVTIINKTAWNTEDLKKLTEAIIKSEGCSPYTKITIVYRKQDWMNGISGWAWLNTVIVRMRVPRPFCSSEQSEILTAKETDEKNETLRGPGITGEEYWWRVKEKVRIGYRLRTFPVEEYAQVLMHELAHNRGLRHKDMLKSEQLNVDKFKHYQVRLKEGIMLPEPKEVIKKYKALEETDCTLRKYLQQRMIHTTNMILSHYIKKSKGGINPI